VCSGYTDPPASMDRTSIYTGECTSLKVVDMFYLIRWHAECRWWCWCICGGYSMQGIWNKFRQLVSLLSYRPVSRLSHKFRPEMSAHFQLSQKLFGGSGLTKIRRLSCGLLSACWIWQTKLCQVSLVNQQIFTSLPLRIPHGTAVDLSLGDTARWDQAPLR